MLVYPNANVIVPMATVRRERRLPPDVTTGEVLVNEGRRVDANTPVLRGVLPSSYRIISLLAPLGVKRVSELDPTWIRVAQGETTSAGDVLAQRGTGRRAPRVLAPVDCIVTRIEPDRLILQVNPEEVVVNAITPGTVAAVRSKTAVQIESVGALIQCAWGNGRIGFGIYKQEPESGLQMLADETLLTTFRNQILLTTRPLTNQILGIARQQEVAAIIAPSMPSEMRATALAAPIPIVLTEGFGAQQMSEIVYNLLRDNLGRQTSVNATEPTRWSSERPELFIPLPAGGGLPPQPISDQPLAVGSMVRLARAPYQGQAGRVKSILDAPQTVENGMRMAGAEIQLANGQMVFAPFANIEMLGRVPDGKP